MCSLPIISRVQYCNFKDSGSFYDKYQVAKVKSIESMMGSWMFKHILSFCNDCLWYVSWYLEWCRFHRVPVICRNYSFRLVRCTGVTQITCNAITCCSAQQNFKNSRASLWQHGTDASQFITMNLCTFLYVGETNTLANFGWKPIDRGRSRHMWSIPCTLLVTFLPRVLPFFLPHMHRPNGLRLFPNGSKDAVWRKDVPSRQVFLYTLMLWGSFCPNKNPKYCPQ